MASSRSNDRKSAVGRTAARIALAGAAIAAPIAMAMPANAASGSTWDALAQCESSGNWHANTGNGFYGGLQFTKSTWSSFGGGQYAASAHQASREQQIAIAERVLQAQGPNAWPVCSKKIGLTRGSGLQNQAVAPKKTTPKQTTPKKVEAPVKQTVQVQDTYVVQAGDTLSSIAEKAGTDWQSIFDKNRAVLTDPDVIFPGQQITTK